MAKENSRKGGRRKKDNKPVDPLALAPLQTVLDQLGVTKNDWDAVIVGDGSGSSWDASCGWASILIDRNSKHRHIFYGAMSCGTVHLSELLPYLQALLWYDDALKNWLSVSNKVPLRIHIITDSKITADAGNKVIKTNTNKELWASFDALALKGYQIKWHWMGRNGTELNILADQMSKLCRTTINSVALPEGNTVYAFNPAREA